MIDLDVQCLDDTSLINCYFKCQILNQMKSLSLVRIRHTYGWNNSRIDYFNSFKLWINSIFPGPHADYLRNNFKRLRVDYDMDLEFRSECVDLKLRKGPHLVHDDPLQVDSKYRIFIKTEVEPDPRNPDNAGKTIFHLTRYEKAEIASSQASPIASGKRFIRF